MLIEAALVLMLVLLVTFGAMEYGWMFLKAQEVTNAARHGARVAVRADATNPEVESGVDAFMAAAGITGHSITISPGTVISPGEVVTVTVTAPYADGAELLGISFLPVPATLQSAVSMTKEGP